MTDQEFWERCGFKVELCHHIYCAYDDKNHTHIYDYNNPSSLEAGYGAVNRYPKFTLDNLFKWAVPQLKEKCRTNYGVEIRHFSDCDGKPQTYLALIYIDGTTVTDKFGQDPAQALYQAIKEAFENEHKR